MKMSVDLYYTQMSAPCRSVLMVAKHLNISVNIIPVNLMAGDHLKPEFLEINPAHTVPTLVDDDLALWESRAIMTYLCNQYAPDSTLYPSDPEERASVDRWLQFDMSSLYKSISEYLYPMFAGTINLDKEKEKTMCAALEVLDNQLSANKYVSGSRLTLADISIINSIDFLTDVMDYDITNNKDYKFVAGWQARLKRPMQGLPYYREVCEEGIEQLRNFVRQQVQKVAAANPAAK